MSEYKSLEQLKKELGDKFEEYMYEANIELLNKINRAIGLYENCKEEDYCTLAIDMYDILKESEE